MKDPTDIGMNRTGIQSSPLHSKTMIQSSAAGTPSTPGDSSMVGKERVSFTKDMPPIGTMPPPGSVKGAVTTVVQALKGEKATVFLDKIGERLAFERTGVRLYEAMLSKLEAFGSWDGGPTEDVLREYLADEMEHFDLLVNTMKQLGGDPTAMTPSADIASVVSQGVPMVLLDARTNLRQCLDALIVAELADNAAWELLSELARGLNQDALANEFDRAAETEAKHLAGVRSWIAAGIRAEAGATAPRPSPGAPVQP